MKKTLQFFASVLTIVGAFGAVTEVANAQTQATSDDSGEKTRITVAPRFAYYFDDFSTSGFVLLPQVNGTVDEAVEFPAAPLQATMAGLNVSIQPASLPRATFSLGVLYGEGEDRQVDGLIVNSRSGLTPPNPASRAFFARQRTNLNYERLDVEATVQYRLNDLIAVIGGVRHERGRVDFQACFQNYDSVNPSATLSFVEADQVCSALQTGPARDYGSDQTLNQLSATLGRDVAPSITDAARRNQATNIFWQNAGRGEDGYDTTTVRGGLAFVAPLTEDRRHRAYANGLAVVGHRDVVGPNERRFDKAWVAGPDLTIGYAFSISPKVTLDTRYRATYLFPLSGPRDADNPRASHGAVVSLALGF